MYMCLPTGAPTPRNSGSSSELVLAMRLDGHIRRRICHASQAEAIAHLVIVQEGLVRLVDGARHHLARAARARPGAARVGQLDALLLGLIQDVRILWALELLCAIGGLQGHLEVRSHAFALRPAAHDRWRRASR